MTPIIEARDLVKKYNGKPAVDGITFSVARGEAFGLLGPNGAGKTTTIKMLFGFSPVTSGELLLFGLPMKTHEREIKSKIGVCHQENTLDPDLTVEQNLWVNAGYYAIPRQKILPRVAELLAYFSLSHRKEDKVMELSGGMARRLNLARSLINAPELLILDEPTTGLDPQSRQLLWQRLVYLKQQGMTLLLTTHYKEEAARLCDRLLIIDQGKIIAIGNPNDLIKEHVGQNIIEIEGTSPKIIAGLKEMQLAYEDLKGRLIVFPDDDGTGIRRLRESFPDVPMDERKSHLEDVFLRLTGRELRE